MSEEDRKMLSGTTSLSSEDIKREEQIQIPQRDKDIAVGAEEEEKKIPDENGKESEDKNEAESLQNIEASEPEEMTEKDRLVLYEKGVRLKRKGNNKHALPCFLSCLQGLKERDHFPVLPECLHNIAEIYSQEEEYEAAIQFAQAEKLYYETALITVDNKAEPDSNIDSISAEAQGSSAANSTDAQKAEEYEKLAHMCLKQQSPQLALEYCAKAVKLQQSCYGERHPVTLKTLDLFTVIYAEMGKQQYKAALEKFSEAQEKEKEAKASKETTKQKEDAASAEDGTQEKPCSKESDRTAGTKTEDVMQEEHEQEQTQSTTDETTPASQDTVKVTMTSSQALMVYFIITILLAVILTTALCYVTQTDPKTTYNYMITRIRFYYYYYFKRKGPNGHQYF